MAGLALVSGCMNLSYRTEDGKNKGPYFCTRYMAENVAIPFQNSHGGENGITQALATIFLPFTIIDTPFEAVADTVFLPWDLIQEWRTK